MKRIGVFRSVRGCWLAALLGLPVLVSGCAVSKLSNPFGAGSDDTTASTLTEDRLLEPASSTSAEPAPGMGTSCPQVVAWPKDRLQTIYQSGHDGDAQSVIHRGEITKMSRECQIMGGRVMVKYGIAGRVLLGPKGKPGTVTMPISVRAAGVDKSTLASDRMSVSATVPQGNPVGYFSIVRKISFPVQVGTRPEDYRVFIAIEGKR
ncbi:MAG: hypothetical protein ACREDO_01060 [Methyloceanibacter sp.]